MDDPDITDDATALAFLRGQMLLTPPVFQLTAWLEQSCHRGFLNCVKFLLERGAQLEDHVPLTEACKSGCEKLVLFLLSRGAPLEAAEDDTDGPLHAAAQKGREQFVKLLVSAGASVNQSGSDGNTPLHVAASNRQFNIAVRLISLGADINTTNTINKTPLAAAITGNAPPIAKLLLEAGCDTSEVNGGEASLLKQAFSCNRPHLVRLLLDHCHVDFNGSKLLHDAASLGQLSIMQMLIEAGADVETRDDLFEATPLFFASRQGNRQAVELLMQTGADINARCGRSNVLHSCLRYDADAVRNLVDLGAGLRALDEYGRTALFVACEDNLVDVAEILIEGDADVEEPCYDYQMTPLHRAAERNNVPIMQLLIRAGANVSAKASDYYESTPLLFACRQGHLEAIGVLMEAGADVNVRHRDDGTVLHCDYVFSAGVVQKLVGLGINVNVLNSSGETALFLTLRMNRIGQARLLIEGGADANVPCGQQQGTALHEAAELNLAQMLELLITSGGNVDAADLEGCTPLMLACRRGSEEAAGMLLGKGANANAVSNSGMTPLHHACSVGRANMVSLLLAREGIDVDAASPLGGNNTPLHLACSLGHADIVELLLGRGARVSLSNQDGQTPWDVALEHHDVLLLFAANGA